MELRKLDGEFSFCKLGGTMPTALEGVLRFYFSGEKSLLCPTSEIPSDTIEREDGFNGFYIDGKLDFSLIGIMSAVSGAIASAGISLCVESTFDTDYFFVKKERFEEAFSLAKKALINYK